MPDSERIAARLESLWQIARAGGGADRPAFSAAEAEAMTLVAGWAREAGLAPGIDRFGNLWALPDGADGSVVTSGSHVDTVPDGGRYDGALGTVLGLELADSVPGAGLLVRRRGGAPVRRGHRRLAAARRDVARKRARQLRGRGRRHFAAAARDEYLDALADLAAGRAAGRARPRPRGGARGSTARRCARSGS